LSEAKSGEAIDLKDDPGFRYVQAGLRLGSQLMFFHPHSIEMYIAIAIAGTVPIACAYLIVLRRWKNELTFWAAAIVTLSFVAVYVAMAVLHFNIGRYPASIMSFERMLDLSITSVAWKFPGLLLTIATCMLALIAWKLEPVRLALIVLSLLVQVVYLVNLAVVLSA
jgi:hypothetical protein